MSYTYRTVAVTNVREKPGTENRVLRTVAAHQIVVGITPIRHKDNRMWIKIISGDSGWMCADIMTRVKDGSVTNAPAASQTAKQPDRSATSTPSQAAARNAALAATSVPQTRLLNLAMSGKSIAVFRTIYAMPFQFTSITDRRAGDEPNAKRSYGRAYGQEILLKTPTITFTPGYPSFLASGIFDIGKAKKNKILAALQNPDDEALSTVTLGKYQKIDYYVHRTNLTRYWSLVNSMMRLHCNLLGINDVVDGVKLGSYNWQQFGNLTDKKSILKSGYTVNIADAISGMDDGVTFAIEPNGSVSGNIGNQTKESALSGIYKGLSDKAREASFLLGMGAGKEIDLVGTDENIEELTASFSDMKKYNPMNPLNRVGSHVGTVRTGANIRFPEIWADSNYGIDYQVTIKLESPYADPVSKAFHVALPFYMLLCLGGAQTYGIDGYGPPFILKAESKGMVSTELAMIDSISWRKYGDGEQLSHDLVPMTMEVTVNFKDLYQVLSLADSRDLSSFWNNGTMLDLIENTAGINMNRLNGLDRMDLYAQTVGKNWMNIPGNVKSQIIDYFRTRDLARMFGINNAHADVWANAAPLNSEISSGQKSYSTPIEQSKGKIQYNLIDPKIFNPFRR